MILRVKITQDRLDDMQWNNDKYIHFFVVSTQWRLFAIANTNQVCYFDIQLQNVSENCVVRNPNYKNCVLRMILVAD